MKAVDYQEWLMINHITDQLHKLGYYDTNGKTYKELRLTLARLRAMEVEAGDPGQGWF